MKTTLFRLFILSVFMLPQLAAAFPKFDNADEIAPFIAALANDKERVTINGVRYEIEFESSTFSDPFLEKLVDRLSANQDPLCREITPAFVKKLLLLFVKFLQETNTKNDLWRFVNILEPSTTKAAFDCRYTDHKKDKEEMLARFKLKNAKTQKSVIDFCNFKSFLGYEKTVCVNNKQSYEIKGIGSASRFTLIGPKQPKTIEPKASTSSTSTTKPKATSDVKKADKKKDITIEPKASTSSTSTTNPKATSDVKKADKKKDKKAAKKDKRKAKKKAKKASKKVAK